MPSADLIRAVAVTAELCGRTFSDAAAEVFVSDLADFPEPAVMAALERCRREVRGVLTPADVVSRIDDGRPGLEEAWAMLPRSEAETAVWTDEMAQAMAVAQPLLDEGDQVAARMAFREVYAKLLAAARDAKQPVRWTASLGHDADMRRSAIEAAVGAGRLTAAHAERLLPRPAQQLLPGPEAMRRIESGIEKSAVSPEQAKAHLAALRRLVGLA